MMGSNVIRKGMRGPLLVCAVALSIAAGVMTPAYAVDRTTAVSPGSLPSDGGCPPPGTRVKTPDHPEVYLVGPDGYWYWILNSSVYFALWDSYSGIHQTTTDQINACDPFIFDLEGAYLMKQSNDPHVYIYVGADRFGYPTYSWITSQQIFDKYGFASDKILVPSWNPCGTPYRCAADWNN